jgi:uncharacterized membrane-anchored protein YhcB (DUF1043 family)
VCVREREREREREKAVYKWAFRRIVLVMGWAVKLIFLRVVNVAARTVLLSNYENNKNDILKFTTQL